MSPESRAPWTRAAKLAVLVASLGYFVDIYDLLLFGSIRKPSLIGLGITDPAILLDTGLHLLNMQFIGLLFGGIMWGFLGDRRGRLSVLFGSIILYSGANLANGMVHTVDQYSICRLIAGIGLAGELGAGVTLVSELLGNEARGWGTTIIAGVGVFGGVAAMLIGGAIPSFYHGVQWRTSYFIGGGLGVALLALRVGVAESGMFQRGQTQAQNVNGGKIASHGNFFALFSTLERARRYICVILVGAPIWYLIGILVMLSTEIGHALGVTPDPLPSTALLVCYASLSVCDLLCGGLSQLMKSRRGAIGISLILAALAMVAYFTFGATSQTAFYVCCGLIGLGAGYWSVFVTAAAEQFGTNLRATVATTAPNFVRGLLPLWTLLFKGLIDSQGVVRSAIIVGVVAIALGGVGLLGLRETFGKDLDYLE